jgi:glucodextranase-like protein
MRRGIGIVALLLLLAGLGTGGFYLHYGRLPWEPPAPPPPLPPPVAAAPTPAPAPVELPPPTLTGETPRPETPGQPIATLVNFERVVKAKRAADLTWEEAKPQMPLYEEDAVRTLEQASATLSFGPDDLVDVDQNSLVIIKPRKGQGEGNEISLALLSSDFMKGLEAKPAEQQKKEIADATRGRELTIRPMPSAGKEKTRIALKTLPDRSTTVAVLSGSLKVVGPKGGEVVLKEKMVTKVSEAGLMATPRVLPASPELVFPKDGQTYPFLRKSPRIEMTWKPVDRARMYRLVVSRDPSFRKISVDERLPGTSFQLQNLEAGTYYWRVRAQDPDGFEGAFSAVRSVKTVFNDAPPQLAITAPPEMFVSPLPKIDLRGRTDAGSRVKVNGQKIEVGPDGTFLFPLILKEGVNLVTIEAVNPAGVSQYGRRLITYKGAKRSANASVSGNR